MERQYTKFCTGGQNRRNMKIQDIGGDSTGQTYSVSVSSVTHLNMRKYKFAESHKTFLIFKVVEHEMSTQSCVLSHTHRMDSVCEKCNLFKKLSIYTVARITVICVHAFPLYGLQVGVWYAVNGRKIIGLMYFKETINSTAV